MTHKLKVTNGSKLLAANILGVAGSLTTPSEIVRAAHLIDKLKEGAPAEAELESWLVKDADEFEITEAQRDLLKSVVEKNATHIPPSVHSARLLEQLGFAE